MKDKIQIFLDMDGVLADFHLGAKTKFGLDIHAMNKMKEIPNNIKKQNSVMWAHIRKNPQFWLDLQPTEDAFELWEHFRHLDPIILTAAPATFSVGSETFLMVGEMKKEWIKKTFGMNDSSRFICTTSTAKHKHIIEGKTNFLIDDNIKIISNWSNTGNIGILHKTSKKSIQEYENHIKNLKNSNKIKM